jgi:hypothetical protein
MKRTGKRRSRKNNTLQHQRKNLMKTALVVFVKLQTETDFSPKTF